METLNNVSPALCWFWRLSASSLSHAEDLSQAPHSTENNSGKGRPRVGVTSPLCDLIFGENKATENHT